MAFSCLPVAKDPRTRIAPGEQMYGMINRGLQEMVLAQHGETVWQVICEKAGAKDTIFVRMDTYQIL